jgi:hypothetical protein
MKINYSADPRLGNTGLDNQPTDGGKVVIPKHRPRSSPQKHSSSASGTHFSKLHGLVRLEGLGT